VGPSVLYANGDDVTQTAAWLAEIDKESQQPVYFARIDGLAVEKVTDEIFNVWTTPTNLTNWDETFDGVGAVDREATIVHPAADMYSAKLTQGTTATILTQNNITLVPNTKYRMLLRVYTPTVLGQWQIRLKNNTTLKRLAADGSWGTVETVMFTLHIRRWAFGKYSSWCSPRNQPERCFN